MSIHSLFLSASIVALAASPAVAQESDLDRALREARGDAKTGPTPNPQAAPTLRLVDVSLDALFAVGGSTQKDAQTEALQGGGHDPHRRGFNSQNIEVSLTGAVDPYFTAEAHFIYFTDAFEGETHVELEETFAKTTALPHGLQLKAGQFFTEFGRINAQHPHQWVFQDQPVIHTRVFGGDGMRGPGARLGWLMPVPIYSEIYLGVQNANGETMRSFLANDEVFAEAPVGNRQFVEQPIHSLSDFAWLFRWSASFDLSPEITAVPGLSVLSGPNATGPDGSTLIYGADLKVKWLPAQNERGWPFVTWQTEWIARQYEADAQDFDPDGTPANGDEFTVGSETLKDSGLYTQVLYGFRKHWAAGLRFEMADGSSATIDPASGADVTESDPLRDHRVRMSAMLGYHPTEFSRIRIQYNYDKADHLDDPLLDDDVAHSIWLGFEFSFGAHPAHTY